MTDLTHDHLDNLLEHDTDENIRETVLAIKSLLVALDSETDADRKATVTEKIRDLKTILEHEQRDGGRGGEDYINDGEFHARG
jgi:allophanate hydrolase subunit 1